MKKRIIPDTDLGELYPLGFGTTFAADKWNKKGMAYVLDAFLEKGGNVIDTARVYALLWDSEALLGEWLADPAKRHRAVVISKGGHPDLKTMAIPRMDRKDMEADLNQSLLELKTDYIDIYLYHRDDVSRPASVFIDQMEEFVRAGKIRYYGCSNWTLSRIKEAAEYAERKGCRGFVMNQIMFNPATDHMNPPADRTLVWMDEEFKEYHAKHPELFAAAYSGNAGGFFQKLIENGEERVKKSNYLTDKNRERAEKIRELAEKKKITLSQAVFGYYTVQNFDCIPLFAPRNAENLTDIMGTFDTEFNREDYEFFS